MTDETFGSLIRWARKLRRLPQVDLAHRIGVSSQTLRKWEHDQTCPRRRLDMIVPLLAEELTPYVTEADVWASIDASSVNRPLTVTNRIFRTHCRNGHEFTPETTRWEKGGRHRKCRACDQEWNARNRVRIRVSARSRYWAHPETFRRRDRKRYWADPGKTRRVKRERDRERRRERAAASAKVACSCGCGTMIPEINTNRKTARFAHGHHAKVSNPRAKLTRDEVASIRKRYRLGGVSHRSLAAEYNVTKSTITDLLSGKHWTRG